MLGIRCVVHVFRLVQVWYPLTVCTSSRYQKVVLKDYLAATHGA